MRDPKGLVIAIVLGLIAGLILAAADVLIRAILG